jgi:hypothetical protein
MDPSDILSDPPEWKEIDNKGTYRCKGLPNSPHMEGHRQKSKYGVTQIGNKVVWYSYLNASR